MHLLDNGTQVSGLGAPQPAVGTPGYAATGLPGAFAESIFDPDTFNTMLVELAGVALLTGVPLNRFDNTQVAKALKTLAAGNSTPITVSTSLNRDMAGMVVVDASAGDVTLGLPPANITAPLSIQYQFKRIDNTANSVFIVSQGANQIAVPIGFVTTLQLLRGGSVILKSDTVNWMNLGAEGLVVGARGVAPMVATSAQGLYPGAGYSGTVSVSFTPLCNGWVTGIAAINQGVGTANTHTELSINGVLLQTDQTTISKAHTATRAVVAGVAVTVALLVTTAVDPGANITYHVAAIFTPNN